MQMRIVYWDVEDVLQNNQKTASGAILTLTSGFYLITK